ncbi:MAG: hypothetical protein JWP11_1300 [Frankiales bacterium]|nr:hypothetical protein [Frankiales bacterium]
MEDPSSVPSCGPVCDPCRQTVHEACKGCPGCGCCKSAQARAHAGPKLPDPAKYKGAP